MVCLGESFTFPAACELVVTVREIEPEEAVMVTDVALVACQVNVTICPAVIAFDSRRKLLSVYPKFGELGLEILPTTHKDSC